VNGHYYAGISVEDSCVFLHRMPPDVRFVIQSTAKEFKVGYRIDEEKTAQIESRYSVINSVQSAQSFRRVAPIQLGGLAHVRAKTAHCYHTPHAPSCITPT
jgi:hypothetical protein